MNIATLKQEKFRRMILFIPVISVPFAFMLFWALSRQTNNALGIKTTHGLNLTLPEPLFGEESDRDKMALYQQALQDSFRLQEQMRNDPYHTLASADSLLSFALPDSIDSYTAERYAYPDDDLINQRLSGLHTQLETPSKQERTRNLSSPYDAGLAESYTGTIDPEIAQLDAMLEKILDLQDPSRTREKQRLRSMEHKGQVYSVSPARPTITDLIPQSNGNDHIGYGPGSANSFFGISETAVDPTTQLPAVAAIVAQTATVISGATIRLQLSDDIFINGTMIPKGSFIYGTCSLNGDRLLVSVRSVRCQRLLFPVNLVAYDLDGIEGIYMPGAVARDVSKNTAQDALGGVNYLPPDNSIPMQAAGIGLQAVRSLFSKKAKLVKVTVRSGYQVLLKDNNAKE